DMDMPFGFRLPTSLVGRLFGASAMALALVMALVVALILGGLQWGDGYLTKQELRSFLAKIEAASEFDATGAFVRMSLHDESLGAMHDGLPKDIAFRIIDAASGRSVAGSPAGPATAILQLQQPDVTGSVQA